MRVLLTAAGGDLAGAVYRLLREHRDVSFIYGIDMLEQIALQHDLDGFEQGPRANNETYVPFLLDLMEIHGLDVLIPMNEYEMRTIIKHRNMFKNYKVLINTAAVLEQFGSQWSTNQTLAGVGLAVPKSMKYKNFIDSLTTGDALGGYPLVLKANISSGSNNVFVVQTLEELQDRAKYLQDPIIQEHIDGEEYTTTVFSDGTVINTLAFVRKLGAWGGSNYTKTVYIPAIDTYLHQLAKKTNLIGAINVQGRIDKKDGLFKCFEINPRLSASIYFKHAADFKELDRWLEMLDTGSIPDFSSPKDIEGYAYIDYKVKEI